MIFQLSRISFSSSYILYLISFILLSYILILANAKLGVVHGFAGVLGGLYEKSPHGAICASLLPTVFRANIKKIIKLQKMNKKALFENNDSIISPTAASDVNMDAKLERFNEVARIVTGNSNATAMDGADWLEALVRDLNVPGLQELCNMTCNNEDIRKIVKATAGASSTAGNPVVFSEQELEEILRSAL